MVKFEDYQFHYSITGNRKNPVIIFLHGFIGSSNDFSHIVSLLADRFCCLSIDLPGHGKTKVFGGEECYSMPNTAKALIDLLNTLKIEKCFLVGYSMGGRLALYLAVYFPNYFVKAVIESASVGLKAEEEKLLRIQADFKLAEELEISDFKHFLLKWYNQPIFKTLKEHPNFEALLEKRLDNNPLELAKSLRQMGTGCQPYLGDRLEDNKIPLLLLAGEYDEKFKLSNNQIAKTCKFAESKIVSNCGHNIHFERTDEWIKHLKEFFN